MLLYVTQSDGNMEVVIQSVSTAYVLCVKHSASNSGI